ncbi:MAG: 30S ribosomal protein S3 [Verrucomicrobia bacterium]|nr:30S ribosomal protein S3 [Verrucomicrobiota bacterium]
MGQKVNPIGLRVAVNKDWRSRWFSGKKNFGNMLNEDLEIRTLIKKRLEAAAVARVDIERYANRVRISIHTARPGIVIGRKGQDIEKIRSQIAKKTGKEVYIEIKEIRDPDANAQLVAENIAMQMVRRVSFRRAMKRAMKMAMDLGVEGIKIRAAGRLGGSELARTEWYKEGKIPLHTLRANIDYGFTEANTTAGLIGVKVWVCKKDEDPAAGQRGAKRNATYA